MINTAQIVHSIKRFLDEDENLNSKIQYLLTGILKNVKSMAEKTEEYEPDSLIRFIGGFVENNLTQIKSHSLEQMILRAEYISIDDTTECRKSIVEEVTANYDILVHALRRIYNELKAKSEPLFSFDPKIVDFAGKKSDTRYVLIVPSDHSCDHIYNILKTIVFSGDTIIVRGRNHDSITMMQYEVGLALYDYKYAKEYELEYNKNWHIGIHLRENGEFKNISDEVLGEDWRKLPSIIPSGI